MSEPSPITAEEQAEIRRHQAEAQIGARKAIYIANLFTAGVVAVALLPYVPGWQLAAWLLAVAAVLLPVLRRWMHRWREIPSGYRIGQWDFRMSMVGASAAAMWVVPQLLAPPGSHGHKLLLAYLTIGLTSVTFAGNPFNTALSLTYALVIGLPFAALGVAGGEPMAMLIGILMLPYLAYLLAHQRAGCRRLLRAIREEHRNRQLAAELALANRRLEQQVDELAEAKLLAETATRAKSQFLANMSHELRTPLNAILGFSEVLNAQMFGPIGNSRYAEYAGDIHGSGRHLLSLINDILDMSKIEAGRFELHEDVRPIADLVASAVRIVAAQADAQLIEIRIDIDDTTALRADERAVRQMLLNLLSNAIKFTQPGGQIRIASETLPNGDVSLAVADTGIGIAAEDVERVLRPFGQVDNAMTRSRTGTGLGLSVVKSLIEMHGGGLRVASEVGRGTTVSLWFPRQRVLPPPAVRSVALKAS